jgi:protein SCO1
MKSRLLQTTILIISCILLGVVAGVFTSRFYQTNELTKPEISGMLWPNPKEIGPFMLMDQNGNAFGLEQLTGKWSFLFFGYTNCPDICPITLTVLAHVYEKLSEQGQVKNIQVIFVSVDPDRDTPEVINLYVNYFNKNFIGLTGSEEQIASLSGQIGIVHMRGEEKISGEYIVDHTASVFLLSPEVKWLGIFSAPHTKDDILSRFQEISKFIKRMSS